MRWAVILVVSLCLVGISVPVAHAACTYGQDCYCDCIRAPQGTFKNATCQAKGRPGDATNLMLCEDWDAPTLHDNIGIGSNVSPFGPPYDDAFFGNCPADINACARGANGYFNRTYGPTNGGCAWPVGSPANPTFGHPCGQNYSVANGGQGACFPAVYGPNDNWQAGINGCMSFPRNGEFSLEDPNILPPTHASGGGSGVFDGNQSMGYRVPVGSSAGGAARGNFIGGGATAFGITMAVAYPSNIVSTGIFKDPWKHNEYNPVQSPGNVGDALMMVHVVGATPQPDDPFHNIIFPLGNGAGGTNITQAQCQNSINNAVIRKGNLSCDNQANFRFKADAATYLQSRDWPFGEWGCIRGQFQFASVNSSVKITLTTAHVTDMVIIDFDHFDDSVLDSHQGYQQIAWNNFANANQGLGGIPTTSTAMRYEDNIHITKGTAVSCAQIGFQPAGPSHTITVSKSGFGLGTVTSDVGGISCGATCSALIADTTVVTLTATPQSGSTFGGWSGGGCSGLGTCVITVSADVTVTAQFNLVASSHTITIAKTGSGTGSVTSSPVGINCGGTCAFSYPDATVVTLTANPVAGSTFTGWSGGGCSGTGTCVITVSANVTVTATFNGSHQVTVAKNGSGTGTVTSSPAGINCGSTCAFTYADGTVVTLTATPLGVASFAGWSGGGCSGLGTCVITVTVPVTATASFSAPGASGHTVIQGKSLVTGKVVVK